MLPREHGAWAMLYVPMAVGALVAGEVSWRVALIVLAQTFVFIAREPLLIWWRARRRGQKRGDAWRALAAYLALAAVSAAPLIFVSRLFWLLPLGLVATAFLAVNAEQAARREDRTLAGELMAIAGLTLTAPATYYAGGGLVDGVAVWLWAFCALYFASSVFYVKLRVAALNRRKGQERRAISRCAVYHTLLLAALLALASSTSLDIFVFLAFAPVLARSFWSLARPSGELNLRRIGVAEIVYSLFFLAFITLTFRPA